MQGRKPPKLRHLWSLADPSDLRWLRRYVDTRWLRICLLVDALGPHSRLNVAKLARELGVSRATATRWIGAARAARERPLGKSQAL